MEGLNPLRKQNYINIETYRKTGVGVQTPVWFVQDDHILYVRTMAESGKVKRIRNNQEVKIAPCKMDGTPIGEWIPATAREINDPETDQKVDRLLDKKYGLIKKFYALAEKARKGQYTVLEVTVRKES
jgi:PPOX class probable F420-dependent enzyme